MQVVLSETGAGVSACQHYGGRMGVCVCVEPAVAGSIADYTGV